MVTRYPSPGSTVPADATAGTSDIAVMMLASSVGKRSMISAQVSRLMAVLSGGRPGHALEDHGRTLFLERQASQELDAVRHAHLHRRLQRHAEAEDVAHLEPEHLTRPQPRFEQ